MHRFESSGMNQLRKTTKREVGKESKTTLNVLPARRYVCTPTEAASRRRNVAPPQKNQGSFLGGGGAFWACPLSLGLSWLMFEDTPPFLGRYRVP